MIQQPTVIRRRWHLRPTAIVVPTSRPVVEAILALNSCLPPLAATLAVVFSANAIAVVTLVAGLAVAALGVEAGVAVLLVILSLGMETLVINHWLTGLPGVASILSTSASGSITFYDLFAGVLLLAICVRMMLRQRRPALPPASTAVGRALLAYVAVILVTTVVAQFTVPFARLDWSLLYLARLVATMLPFVIVVLVRPEREWLQRYTWLYAMLALVPALVVTLAQSWDAKTTSLRSYFGLITAGGFSSMGLGAYLISVAGISVAMIVLWRRPTRPLTVVLATISLAASLATTVLVQKRAAFVGLALALFALPVAQALLPPSWHRRRWRFVVLLIALIVAGGVIRGGIFDRTFLSGRGTIESLKHADQWEALPTPLKFLAQYGLDPNITGRVAQWYRATEAALRYPLGVGFRAMSIGPYSYPHNQYLQVIDESSAIGLACFAWLNLAILRVSLRLQQSKDRLSIILGAGVFSGLVAVLAQGMFDEAFHNWDGMALLWLLVGLAVVHLDRQQPSSEKVAPQAKVG